MSVHWKELFWQDTSQRYYSCSESFRVETMSSKLHWRRTTIWVDHRTTRWSVRVWDFSLLLQLLLVFSFVSWCNRLAFCASRFQNWIAATHKIDGHQESFSSPLSKSDEVLSEGSQKNYLCTWATHHNIKICWCKNFWRCLSQDQETGHWPELILFWVSTLWQEMRHWHFSHMQSNVFTRNHH